MNSSKLIRFTNKGYYCTVGNFYIDPWRPVENALITHGHSDHAIFGHKNYLTSNLNVPIIKHRLGAIKVQGIDYGKTININGVNVTFYPSGHVVGASQIKIEYQGETWVFTGDYKLQDDGISTPFEVVKCQNFVTESTFALPVFQWKKQEEVFTDINNWWRSNKEKGIASVIMAYSLGKAQRVLKNIDPSIDKIIVHGAVNNINNVIRSMGIDLPVTYTTSELSKEEMKTALVVGPSSILGTSWLRRFYPYSIAQASGWMQIRGIRRRASLDRGFVLSDHADWNDLNTAVKESGAEKVFVNHGYTSQFSRWLNEKGIESYEVQNGH